LVVFYTGIFLLVISKYSFFRSEFISGKFISGVFLLKILAGTLMYFIYTYYYKDRMAADIFKYFDDSKPLYEAFWQNPKDFMHMIMGIDSSNPYYDVTYYSKMNFWHRTYENNLYNDSHTIIRFNAVIRFFSFGYYHVHTVFVCFLSLTGLMAIYKSLVKFMKGKEAMLALMVFLLPSVLFWGSGVLKEGLLIFALGLMMWQFMKLMNGESSFLDITLFGFALFILLFLKIYILMALIPGLAAFTLIKFSGNKFIFIKYGSVLLICILCMLYFDALFPKYPILETLALKQQEFSGLVAEMKPGSTVYIMPLEDNVWTFIKAAPLALFNVFFRPFFFEASSFLVFMAGLENLMLIMVAVICFRFARKRNEYDWNIVLFFSFFIILLFLLIGWITPVYGAIARYKVPALPFLGFLFIYILDKNKLKANRFVKTFKGKKMVDWLIS